jgi:hypothetical protein
VPHPAEGWAAAGVAFFAFSDFQFSSFFLFTNPPSPNKVRRGTRPKAGMRRPASKAYAQDSQTDQGQSADQI